MTGSVAKWLQELELDQAEASSGKHHLGPSSGWQELRFFSYYLLLPKQVSKELDWKWSSPHLN